MTLSSLAMPLAIEPDSDATVNTKDAAEGATLVSARSHRPQKLSQLFGQDVLVQTLTHAIEQQRLPHAFVLTGIRGVGKTTTARIMAKALNCVGVDGAGGPTPEPCGQCGSCVAIQEDRHLDVIEMDAASHTGVDDMRELIEAARYRPTQGRYKIYIIDEAHMLSKSAFNALLKTLETPPPYVKFIFATTEIRKVPATVLSRCMRFDLPRLTLKDLQTLFEQVLKSQGGSATPEALALLAQAADGSARDGLSLLDQGMALSGGTLTEEGIRRMLGMADPTHLTQLYSSLLKGNTKAALDTVEQLYHKGSEAQQILQDLLTLTHQLLVYKTTDQQPDAAAPVAWMAEIKPQVSVPVLTRFWQVLLKGHEELQRAPAVRAALDMVLIRLAYVQDLPTPNQLKSEGGGGGTTRRLVPESSAEPQPILMPEEPVAQAPVAKQAPVLQTLADVIALTEARREPLLRLSLMQHVHFIKIEGTAFHMRPTPQAPKTLVTELRQFLQQETGESWQIILHQDGGAPTPQEQQAAADEHVRQEGLQDPWVQEALKTFPGSVIESIEKVRMA